MFYAFTRRQFKNFFMQLIWMTKEGHLRNIFWVDAKYRNDYQEFGDVIFFGTTYITNK